MEYPYSMHQYDRQKADQIYSKICEIRETTGANFSDEEAKIREAMWGTDVGEYVEQLLGQDDEEEAARLS